MLLVWNSNTKKFKYWIENIANIYLANLTTLCTVALYAAWNNRLCLHNKTSAFETLWYSVYGVNSDFTATNSNKTLANMVHLFYKSNQSDSYNISSVIS